MLEVYKPHTNRFAVGVWLCSAAKRPSERSALVYILKAQLFFVCLFVCVFVCPELIGKTTSPRKLKSCIQV